MDAHCITIRGDQGHVVRGWPTAAAAWAPADPLLQKTSGNGTLTPQSEVIRAILLDGSPLNHNPR